MEFLKISFKYFALASALVFANTSVYAIPLTMVETGSTALLSNSNRFVRDYNKIPDSKSQQATSSIRQFDASNGVLLGVTAKLTPGSNTTFLRADGNFMSSGTTSVSATWNSANGLNVTGLLNSVTRNRGPNSYDGVSNSWTPLSQTITNNADLNSWVGTGSVNSTINTTLTADRDKGAITARIGNSGNHNVDTLTDLTGSHHVTYDYLQHAAPSFAGDSSLTELTLDLGERTLGEVASIGFSLFNLMGNRVGFDLDLIAGSGDTAVLSTDLTSFASLAAGGHLDFFAFLDTSNLGSYAATYVLNLSDEDIGASDSRYAFNDYLTVHLMGSVIEEAPLAAPAAIPIPEPDMLALVAFGLLGFLGIRKK